MNLNNLIQLTNKLEHPTRTDKVVYRYFKPTQASRFAELLRAEGIDFEMQVDEDHHLRPTYVGVARRHGHRLDVLNYTALAVGREKFIPTAGLRWLVIAVFFLAVLLVVGGIINSA